MTKTDRDREKTASPLSTSSPAQLNPRFFYRSIPYRSFEGNEIFGSTHSSSYLTILALRKPFNAHYIRDSRHYLRFVDTKRTTARKSTVLIIPLTLTRQKVECPLIEACRTSVIKIKNTSFNFSLKRY